MKSSSLLFFVFVFLISAVLTSSAQTVAVGNCRPHIVSYATISEAVAAVTPNSIVDVCPGTYPEQVTITQPLTLNGLSLGTGSNPVITVPSSGLEGDFPAQVLVQQPDGEAFGPVDISNLVVDGTGSGVNCSTGELAGIEYVSANGTLENVEVRNQSPGGCGFGILLSGDNFAVNTVHIRRSSIHDFDNTGILAESGGGSNFEVNLTSNWIASTSASVQSGVEYAEAQGLATFNTIQVGGKIGLNLANFFCCLTASGNTVVGSNVGIYLGGNDVFSTTTVTRNSLFNNGTGILVNPSGAHVINLNAIVQSTTTAIDLNCSSETTAKHNVVFGAPTGIANVTPGDVLIGNNYYSVTTATTTCP